MDKNRETCKVMGFKKLNKKWEEQKIWFVLINKQYAVTWSVRTGSLGNFHIHINCHFGQAWQASLGSSTNVTHLQIVMLKSAWANNLKSQDFYNKILGITVLLFSNFITLSTDQLESIFHKDKKIKGLKLCITFSAVPVSCSLVFPSTKSWPS